MKTYVVLVTATAEMIVQADSEDDALGIAGDSPGYIGGFEIEETELIKVLDSEQQIADALRRSSYHQSESRNKVLKD